MAQMILIDTDILIDVRRGIEEAVNYLKQIEEQETPGISIITTMELIVGSRNKRELTELERFLQRFQIINLNEAIANKATDLIKHYRLSHGLLIADALIAATAIISEILLVTKNQRDFRFMDELHLINYPQ